MRRKLHFVVESSSMVVFVNIGRFQHPLKEPSSYEKVQQGEWNSEKKNKKHDKRLQVRMQSKGKS
jgi:hypothetical protein